MIPDFTQEEIEEKEQKLEDCRNGKSHEATQQGYRFHDFQDRKADLRNFSN